MKKQIKKWAVIWIRDKNILGLYGMKKTDILTGEWQETTGDKAIFESCMVFNRKIDAEKYKGTNKDFEAVRVEIEII